MSSVNMQKIKSFAIENSVFILFLFFCVFGFFASQLSAEFVAKELFARIGRNTFLVLSLIIPVVAGMGLNFGIVVGAMIAQIAMVFITDFGIVGVQGIFLSALLATPFAALAGYLAGLLMNKMKGQEMIGSLFLGYFCNGLYQFFMLVIMGSIIHIASINLLINGGVGIKNVVDLKDGIKYGLDNLVKVPAAMFINTVIIITICVLIFSYFRDKKKGLHVDKRKTITSCLTAVAGLGIVMIPRVYYILYYINIPLITFLVIGMLILFNRFILNTRLGQNMRTVGQSRVVANAAGIKVDRVRITAIIISTVFASWGQIISLQNLGTIQTYSSHEQVGLFAVASLLVGGASVHKATNAQAVIGVILFHTLFIVAPFAGKNLFHSAQLGEYFRVAVAYGVICISLMMYAMKVNSSKKA